MKARPTQASDMVGGIVLAPVAGASSCSNSAASPPAPASTRGPLAEPDGGAPGVKRDEPTADQQTGSEESDDGAAGSAEPGLVLIFSAGRPFCRAIPFDGRAIEVGRESLAREGLDDPHLSRRHAEVTLEAGRLTVRDLGSRNGTAVDAEQVHGTVGREGARWVRTGGTIFLLCADTRPFRAGIEVAGGKVTGPALRAVWTTVGRAARRGGSLHVTGESGTGKELAARAFHRAGPFPDGPFVAVNCAAIPAGLAERLLFGSRKGAYSGAGADAEGHVQVAHGGTLFLDEVAELELAVQAKLLRVVETREVLMLGASRPTAVDFRLCSATHRDLRAQVVAGRLREDLYFRIGRPEVVVPPLRERLEEMPWLIAGELQRVESSLVAAASFVEACLLRPWPGNVRELLTEVRAAAFNAIDGGSREVKAQHLPATAGLALAASRPAEPGSSASPSACPEASPQASPPPTERHRLVAPAKTELEALMKQHAGVIGDVASELGCSRRQIGRWLELHAIERSRFRA